MKHRSTSARPSSSAPEAPQRQRWTVDAIEETPQGRVARIELPDGRTTDLKLTDLPGGVQEGDLLQIEQMGEHLNITVLHEESKLAREQARSRLEALNAAGAAGPDQEMTL